MKNIIFILFCFLIFGCQSGNFFCCQNKINEVEDDIVKKEINKNSQNISPGIIINYENKNEDPKDVISPNFLIDIPSNTLFVFDYLYPSDNQNIPLTQDQITDNINKVKEKDIIKDEVKKNNSVQTLNLIMGIIGIIIFGIILFIIIWMLMYPI